MARNTYHVWRIVFSMHVMHLIQRYAKIYSNYNIYCVEGLAYV